MLAQRDQRRQRLLYHSSVWNTTYIVVVAQEDQ